MNLLSIILASLAGLIGFVGIWMITSLAVFVAGRVMVGGHATFPKALALILVGVLLVGVTYIVASLLLTPFFGWIVAFLVWLSLVKHFFGTGWVGALIISILAWLILMLLALGFTAALTLIGIHIPYMPRTPIEEFLPTF